MPALAFRPGVPSSFVLLNLALLLVHVAQGIFVSLLAVLLNSIDPGLPVTTIAGLAVGSTYFFSVVMAPVSGWRFSLPGAAFLTCSGACLVAFSHVWLGIGCIAGGIGYCRPAVQAQIARHCPPQLDLRRAFAIYGVVVNLAYVAGPFCADVLRIHIGWRSVFLLVAGVSAVAGVLGLWANLRSIADKMEVLGDEELHSVAPLFLITLLGCIAVVYCLQAQLVGCLAILVESPDTRPIRALGQLTLTAGTLASLHGLLAIAGGIAYSAFARRRDLHSGWLSVWGLVLYSIGFATLALVSYPASQSWVVVAFVFFSGAESLMSPSLLALGSRLAGARRALFWLAAFAGYLSGGMLGELWSRLRHLYYLGGLALLCLLIGGLLLVRSDDKGWR